MSLATTPQPFLKLDFFFSLMNLNDHFYDTNMKILNAGVRMHISVVVACAVAFKAFSYDYEYYDCVEYVEYVERWYVHA